MCRAVHGLVLLASVLLPVSCLVYDQSLLEGDGVDGRGGSTSASSGGSSSVTGGTNATPGSGGSGSGAGTTNLGGDGSGAGAGEGNEGGSSSTSTGGSAASGGSVSAGGEAGSNSGNSGGAGNPLVFDTMEDGNNIFLLPNDMRGRWYLSNDGSDGEQTAISSLMATIPEGRGSSLRAAHTVASGFTGWGSSVGFTFEDSSNVRTPFDASGYSGVSFYARVEDGSSTSVRVTFPDMNTDPMGDVCNEHDVADCLNHFGVNLTLTTSFVEYVIDFDSLGQLDWGHLEPSVDESKLLGMEVSWGKASIDVWIDDVILLP
jgi:hypothetical protein